MHSNWGVCVCVSVVSSVLRGSVLTHDAVCVDVTPVPALETPDLADLHSKRLLRHLTTALGRPVHGVHGPTHTTH